MQPILRGFLIALMIALVFGASSALAQDAADTIVIEDQDVTLEFPNLMTFSAYVESSNPMAEVVLEYGVERLTCGTVTARVFPEFTPGNASEVSWTWEMRQSGSEPPGAQIWYRWRVIDEAGNAQVAETQQVTWLDAQHDWRTVSEGMLSLHWYAGSSAFAEELLATAVTAMEQLSQTTGVTPESPVDLYIYADTVDMREAVLYEPGWTGGQAYPAYDIVIIGISPDELEWGKSTIAHELTHVLVGHLTFSCLGSVPTWLNEGIAVYGEGGLDPAAATRLEEAITADELLSVRSLSGAFSEHPDKADLSYSQSYSLVNFLIEEYGAEQLLALFGTLRDGLPVETGLQQIYGFGLEGLEDQWRAAVGAPARQTSEAEPTATPEPTPVPTYPPIDAVPQAPSVAVTSVPTDAPAPTATATPVAAAALDAEDGSAGEVVVPPEPAAAEAIGEVGSDAVQSVWPRMLAIAVVAVILLLLLTLGAGIALFYETRRAKAQK